VIAASRSGARTVALALAALFMAFLDATVMVISLPSLQHAFADASLTTLAWILNVYTLVFATLVLPGGQLGDRFGRKRCFLLGVALFGVASLACSVAPGPLELIAARALQAGGAALLVPNSLALLLPELPAKDFAGTIGLWGATGGLAAALGPTVGGLVVSSAGWRWIFLLNMPVAIGVVAFGCVFLRERPRARAGGHGDMLALPLLPMAVGSAVCGIVYGPTWQWLSVPVMSALAASGALGGLFLWRLSHRSDRVAEARLLRTRAFVMANVAFAFFALGVSAALLGSVLFLTTVWGFSALEAGLAVSPGALVALVLALPAGRVANRVGTGKVAACGGMVFSIACVASAVCFTETPNLGLWLAVSTLLGMAGALTFTGLGSAGMRNVLFEELSTGAALATCARQVGGAIGVTILVMILRANANAVVHGFHVAWLSLAVAGAAAAIVAMALPREPEPPGAYAVSG